MTKIFSLMLKLKYRW